MPDLRIGLLPFLLSLLSGFFKLSVTLFEYFFVSAVQLIGWCHVANGAVQSDCVVVFDVLFYYPASIVKAKWYTGADTFSLDGLVESLQLAV